MPDEFCDGPQKPVFDITKCDVEQIYPIPDPPWLNDDRVPQGPPDIDDCFPEPVLVPDPEFPCPDLRVACDILDGATLGNGISIVDSADVAFLLTITKG